MVGYSITEGDREGVRSQRARPIPTRPSRFRLKPCPRRTLTSVLQQESPETQAQFRGPFCTAFSDQIRDIERSPCRQSPPCFAWEQEAGTFLRRPGSWSADRAASASGQAETARVNRSQIALQNSPNVHGPRFGCGVRRNRNSDRLRKPTDSRQRWPRTDGFAAL